MAKKEEKHGSKLMYAILSIILAVASWAVVSYTTNPDITKTINGVKVEIAGIEELRENGLTVLGDNKLPKMSVKVRGKRSDLMKTIDTIRVVADVSGISEAGEYIIEGTAKSKISSVYVDKILSNKISVIVDKYETREFPLYVFVENDADDRLVKSVSEIDMVAISGAKNELDKIDAAYVTVDAKNVTESGKVTMPVKIGVIDGVNAETITTASLRTAEVEITNTVYERREVPVNIDVRNIPDFELDRENSEIIPGKIVIGVPKDSVVDSCTAVISEYSESECTAIVLEENEIFVPDESKEIKVTPVWIPIMH